ncbi:hypothetical protein SUGI_0064340 [Cryptomeria japonica]|nr:hypothetical protein SUGI_0064340 [Cryptomeria japonica]
MSIFYAVVEENSYECERYTIPGRRKEANIFTRQRRPILDGNWSLNEVTVTNMNPVFSNGYWSLDSEKFIHQITSIVRCEVEHDSRYRQTEKNSAYVLPSKEKNSYS